MLSRRDLFRGGAGLAAGALAVPLLNACGGSGKPAGDASPVDTAGASPKATKTAAGSPPAKELAGKIQFGWWGGDERAKASQEVIKIFQQEHANTSVAAQFSDWGSYWQKLSTAAAGGNLPDVIQMSTSYVNQFATKNQLLRLDDQPVLELKGTDKSLLTSGTVNGKLYAVGTGGNMSALMYNETALAAAGKPVPDEGFSWDSFASYAVALQKKLPSNVWVIDAGYSSFWFDVYARQQNKEEWTADGKIGYTKDQVLDWFNYWYDLQKAGVLVPPGKAPNAASGSPADSPFALGFTVMAAEWTNLFPTDVDANKNKLNMTRTPTGGPHVGDSVNATMQWCIAANSANTDLALAFTSFLLHDPKAIKVIGLDRGVPGNEAARKLLKPTLKPAEKLEVDFLDKYGPMSRPSTVQAPAYTGEITDAMTQAGDSMTLGKATPAQASSVFWDAAQKAAAS